MREDSGVVQQNIALEKNTKENKALYWFLGLIILLTVIWLLIKPGVFTIQPIGALPKGTTFIYHSRGPDLPFFSSLDSLCLHIQGSVSLFCRAGALSAATELLERKIIKLPYSHWAYLRSTNGLEFDR